MEISKVRRQVRPAIDKEKSVSSGRSNTRIVWARGLTDAEIACLLQMKLLESRLRDEDRVGLLNELVHEIKHRFEKGKARPDAR